MTISLFFPIRVQVDLMTRWNKFVSTSKLVESIESDDSNASFGGIWGYVELW